MEKKFVSAMGANDMVRRGELWTAREAEAQLGLAKGTIDVWKQRGHLAPAEIPGRPALYWSDDVYDCKFERSKVLAH